MSADNLSLKRLLYYASLKKSLLHYDQQSPAALWLHFCLIPLWEKFPLWKSWRKWLLAFLTAYVAFQTHWWQNTFNCVFCSPFLFLCLGVCGMYFLIILVLFLFFITSGRQYVTWCTVGRVASWHLNYVNSVYEIPLKESVWTDACCGQKEDSLFVQINMQFL